VAEFLLETAIKPRKRSDGSKIDWNDEWVNSKEAQAVIEEIDGLKRMRSKSVHEKQHDDEETEFAAPVWLQTTMLTKRVFTQYWRDPSYLYGKLFVAVIVGIFNGFTFWQLGNSIQDMQNRMFTAFLILTIPPTVVNAVVPKFYQNMALWMARELPSRIYGWVAFSTAMVVGEIPIATVSAVVYWLLWYFPSGLPTDSSTAGYTFLMVLLFFYFQASWGQCTFSLPLNGRLIMLIFFSRDLRLRTKFYRHLQRSTFLLRHVFTIQRCCASLRIYSRLLALLDVSLLTLCRYRTFANFRPKVLRQPLHLLDQRCPR
jgi:ATP-binding cassette subfamily G (WHITE) protein 2 (SNQ2)